MYKGMIGYSSRIKNKFISQISILILSYTTTSTDNIIRRYKLTNYNLYNNSRTNSVLYHIRNNNVASTKQ